MRERGITFAGESIPLLLNDQKTQTRRVINPQPWGSRLSDGLDGKWLRKKFDGLLLPKIADLPMHCPYGKVGGRLWVKETWAVVDSAGREFNTKDLPDELWPIHGYGLRYRATDAPPDPAATAGPGPCRGRWRSSRFMPRWAARIWLEIVEIRVERVCDISEEDAEAEGVRPDFETRSFADSFMCLWDSLNYKRGFGWDRNPWVWPITFRKIKP